MILWHTEGLLPCAKTQIHIRMSKRHIYTKAISQHSLLHSCLSSGLCLCNMHTKICVIAWIKECLWTYTNIQYVQACYLNTMFFHYNLFSAVCSKGNMSDYSHNIISGKLWSSDLNFPFPPSGQCVQGRGADFTLISPDSRRREAVARLGTVITPVSQ